MTTTCDAVVVGGGPNGLVAANALGDAGWDVVLVEAQDEVGGAVRSGEVTAPGFVTDLFSAFYPLAAASPVIRDLDLGAHGLEWRRAPDAVAHAFPDGRGAVVHAAPEDTAAALDAVFPGDGAAWLRLVADWHRVRDPLLDALFTPLPAARPLLRLLRETRVAGAVDLLRLGLLSARRFGHEEFGSEEARVLFTGNAMHSDLPPDGAGSALFGWLLVMLGQDVGFPVPRGGAGELALALRRRAESRGVQVRCGTAVTAVDVAAAGPGECASPTARVVRARKAVLADVSAPALYRDLSRRARSRRGCSRTCAASSGTLDPQGQLGARRPGARGAPTRPATPAPCTSASTTPGSSTSPRTSRSAGCRRGRSSSSAR